MGWVWSLLSPPDDPASRLLRTAARGEPGAFLQLIEETIARAYLHVGQDEAVLLRAFETMKAHLDEVHSRASFWAWFEAIAGPSREFEKPPGAPPESVRQALTALAARPVAESRRNALRERLGRLHLNGWLIGFAASFAFLLPLAVGEMLGEPILPTIATALVGSLLSGAVLSWLFGPWLSLARRCKKRWLAVPVAMVGLLGLHYWFSSGAAYSEGPWQPRIHREWIALGLGLFAGIATEVVCRAFGAGCSWQLYRGNSVWRRSVVPVFLGLPLAWFLINWVPQVWGGWSVDPELALLTRKPGPSDLKFDPAIKDRLPKLYREDTAVQWLIVNTYFADSEAVQRRRESASQLWLAQAKAVWNVAKLEDNPALLALVNSAQELYLERSDGDVQPSLSQLEVGLRCRIVLRSTEIESVLLDDMSLLDEGSETWGRWTEIAEDCEWVRLGPRSVSERLESEFESATDSLELSYDRWNSRSVKWWQQFEARRGLNGRWRLYKTGGPYPGSARPWSPTEVQGLRLLVVDYNGPVAEAMDDFFAQRSMAELILFLELKRLATSGEPIPAELTDLRPYFAEVARLYEGWFELVAYGETVELRVFDEKGELDHSRLITGQLE